MSTLIGKGLIKTLDKAQYTLTEAGRALAKKLESMETDSQAAGNFSPGTKTHLLNNNLLSDSNSSNDNSNSNRSPSLTRSMSAPVPQVTRALSPQTLMVKPLSTSQHLPVSSEDMLSQIQTENDLERALRESMEMSQRDYFYVDESGKKVISKEKAQVGIDEDKKSLKYRIKYKDTGLYDWISEESAQDFDVEDAMEDSESHSKTQSPITTSPPPTRETVLESGTIKTNPVTRVLFPSETIDLTASDDVAQPFNFQLPNAPTTYITSPSVTNSLPSNTNSTEEFPVTPFAEWQTNHLSSSNYHHEHTPLLPALTAHPRSYHLPTQLLQKPLHETEIVLVLDHREQWPNFDMDQQLKEKGIPVERRSLKLSDLVFVIRGVNQDTPEYMMNLVIERKQVADFFASIRDKRLEEQKHRLNTLRSSGINAMVLLEGRLGIEATRENVCILVPQEHLDHLIFMEGFSVKKTKSASQTLDFLIQTHSYLQEALKEARIRISGTTFEEYNRLNAKSFGLTKQSLFERQLMQFYTMTPLTAETITKNFPTVKHLVEAFSKRKQPDMLCELQVGTTNPFHPVSKQLSTRLFNYYCP